MDLGVARHRLLDNTTAIRLSLHEGTSTDQLHRLKVDTVVLRHLHSWVTIMELLPHHQMGMVMGVNIRTIITVDRDCM